MNNKLVEAINNSNMKIGDKSDLFEYIKKIERENCGLITKFEHLKEKEEKRYGIWISKKRKDTS